MKCEVPDHSDNDVGPSAGVFVTDCGVRERGVRQQQHEVQVGCARHKSFQWLDEPFLCRVEESRLRGQARLKRTGRTRLCNPRPKHGRG